LRSASALSLVMKARRYFKKSGRTAALQSKRRTSKYKQQKVPGAHQKQYQYKEGVARHRCLSFTVAKIVRAAAANALRSVPETRKYASKRLL